MPNIIIIPALKQYFFCLAYRCNLSLFHINDACIRKKGYNGRPSGNSIGNFDCLKLSGGVFRYIHVDTRRVLRSGSKVCSLKKILKWEPRWDNRVGILKSMYF